MGIAKNVICGRKSGTWREPYQEGKREDVESLDVKDGREAAETAFHVANSIRYLSGELLGK